MGVSCSIRVLLWCVQSPRFSSQQNKNLRNCYEGESKKQGKRNKEEKPVWVCRIGMGDVSALL